MPPLSVSWLRGRRGLPSSWLTPAQRVVRVLQVTRANWNVTQAGRRKRSGAVQSAPLLAKKDEGD
jgi:hypothetical protein